MKAEGQWDCLPVIPWMASTKRDVFHLEEVTTSVILKMQRDAKTDMKSNITIPNQVLPQKATISTRNLHRNDRLICILHIQCIDTIIRLYLIKGVIFILQAHDQFNSLQANLQLTQGWRSHMHRAFP